MQGDEKYKIKINEFQVELEGVVKKLGTANSELEESIRQKTNIENEVIQLTNKILSLKENIFQLDASIQQKIDLEKSIDKGYSDKIDKYLTNFQGLEAFIKTINSKLDRRIDEINQLIEKNGKIANQIELDKEKLEIYVRRLQRYYDETGIKLKILKVFNLKEE